MPRRGTNGKLVRELRAAWRMAQITRGRRRVRIEHVRSHTSVPGNELADQLAEAGRTLGAYEPDCGLREARRLMRGIALVANTRDQRVRANAPTPPNQPPLNNINNINNINNPSQYIMTPQTSPSETTVRSGRKCGRVCVHRCRIHRPCSRIRVCFAV